MDWLYAHAPGGTSFVSVTSNVPWRARDIERYRYQPLGADLGPSTVPAIEEEMRRNPHGAYLIMTKGQFVFAESFLGKPPGWGEDLERRLVSSGRFRLVYTNVEARAYVLASPEGQELMTRSAQWLLSAVDILPCASGSGQSCGAGQHHRPGPEPVRLRTPWPPLLVLLWGGAVLALVLLHGPAPVRAVAVLAYIAIAPGLACVRLIRLPDRLTQIVVGVALSLALGILVAQAMVYLRRWPPLLGLCVLVVVASLAALTELARNRLAVRRLRQMASS